MAPEDRTVERKLAWIASQAHGVVTRPQLLQAGVSRDEIKWRLRTGALIQEYPGVYRVGHRAPNVEARYLAAVRACGEGALLSGRAASFILGILKGNPPPPEVTAPTQRRIPGVITHRARRIEPEAMSWRGIPTTSTARTLVDLASSLSLNALARACHEAEVLHRTTPAQIEEVLARRPRTRGAGKLRKIIEGDVRVTLSKLEQRFLALLKQAGLSLPETNRPAGSRRVDCRWPAQRLTVELDSYTYHRSRHAWELDRRREREARARGDDFRRFTHDDVFERPHVVLSELQAYRPALGGHCPP